MKRITILIFLFIVILKYANCQVVATETPFIEVTAKAEQEVMPDEITIYIIILEKINGTEKVTVEAREEKLIKEIKSLGIDIKNLTAIDAGNVIKVRPVGVEQPHSKSYLLKVTNASTAKKVFAQLEKLEILSARISKVGYSKMEELQKETTIMAMKAAKVKAEYMLAAVGDVVGKAISVQERDADQIPGPAKALGVPPNSSDVVQLPPPLPVPDGFFEIKKIKVQSEVVVKFEIK